MRKIVIHCTTSTVGTDSWEFVLVEDSISDKELNDLAQEYAYNNAEMYGIYSYDEYSDEDEEDVYHMGDDNIEGIWYDYDPSVHDGYTRTSTPEWEDLDY